MARAWAAAGACRCPSPSVTEPKKLDPDVVIPTHFSGANFIDAVRQQMPETLALSTVGSRFTFGV